MSLKKGAILMRASSADGSWKPVPGSRGTMSKAEEASMSVDRDPGIANTSSNHSVDATVQKIEAILASKGVKLFAVIDHSGEAERAGLAMRPTKLLIFGNPKAGTPLMLAAPTSALDLPLKALVWEDAKGKTWISYNRLGYLKERHGLPPGLVANLAFIETLAAEAAE
jgi:uncharacterized protein (DUF302 family)